MASPKKPPDQMSPWERMLSGQGKILKPQQKEDAAHVQGCGNPDCDICMPKGRPQDAGGAKFGPPTDALFDYPAFLEAQTRQGFVGFFRTSFEQAPTSAPPSRAQMEEQRLREKVKPYILSTQHRIAWEDVIGNEVARQALMEAIEHPVTHAELYRFYGKKPCKGVLLYGPPGCGKTMFGKAAASALARLYRTTGDGPLMLRINGPEIQSPYVGVTEEIIRNIFAYARAYRKVFARPLLVFIDEADAILPSRDGSGIGRRALPWEESNVATFLAEMDGLEDVGALVILATNRPHAIDAAILRDGRCDRRIKVERPQGDAVRVLLIQSLHGAPLAPGVAADAMAAHAVDLLSSETYRLLKLRSNRGVDYLGLIDLVNGAMLVNLIERAKASAFRRDLAAGGKPSGVGLVDIEAALAETFIENCAVNHGYAIGEFVERTGFELHAIEAVKTDKPARLH